MVRRLVEDEDAGGSNGLKRRRPLLPAAAAGL
jgi:hypothetical protein